LIAFNIIAKAIIVKAMMASAGNPVKTGT